MTLRVVFRRKERLFAFFLSFVFCFPLWAENFPSRPTWLDDPIPHFEELERRYYSPSAQKSPNFDLHQKLFGTGIAWAKAMAHEHHFADQIADAPVAASSTEQEVLNWLWCVLGRLEGRPIYAAPPNLFLGRVAPLPLPQEWITRKLLVLAFLYRIAPLGLVTGPTVADGLLLPPPIFALHDANHAGLLEFLFVMATSGDPFWETYLDAARAELLSVRDVLAQEIWNMNEDSEAFDVVFSSIHELTDSFPARLQRLSSRCNLEIYFPRTSAFLDSFVTKSGLRTREQLFVFWNARHEHQIVLGPVDLPHLWPKLTTSFRSDVSILSMGSEEARILEDLSIRGARPLDMGQLERVFGAGRFMQTFAETYREIARHHRQVDGIACTELLRATLESKQKSFEEHPRISRRHF